MKKNILKLKKYLFLISIIFLVSSLSHLVYTFLSYDAKFIPVAGGSISEGLIGDFPSLNPLKTLSGNNKYIVKLLYRSLLKYDLEENKIVSDIASCDISNLSYIECYLEDNIKWSNGDIITSEDIISTYKILQNTNVNPIISSLLSSSEITSKDNIITFKNAESDVDFLNIFFQPIVPKRVIDELGEGNLSGNFSTLNGIYSGKYKIANVSNDLTLGIVKFILEKNVHYFNNPVLINQYIIKLFSDTASFLKNKNSINIFNDKDNIIGDSIPRFDIKKYTLPQFVGIFINKDNIKDVNLRTFILNQINSNNLIKILGEDNYKIVHNPYLTENKLINEASNKNFEELVSKLGYYKKSKLIKLVMQSTKTYSNEAQIEKSIDTTKLSIDDYQQDSEYITSPDFVDKYNFIKKDDILLTGVTPKNTSEVHINDYKLQGFKISDRYFYYRLKTNFDNIKEGENSYKIYFTIDGEKKLYEEIKFLYYKDSKTLDTEKINLLKKLEIEKIKKNQSEKKLVDKSEKKKETINALLEKLNDLDEKFFYNKDLEKLSLNLLFIDGDKEQYKTSLFIENTLKEIGIEVVSKPIAISNIQNYIGSEKKYDMILSGINTGYFPFNLYEYLHSGQVKNGRMFNLSGIRKTSLDIEVEDLQGKILSKEEIKEKQLKVLNILKKEQVLKTLYTPKINLLIDKNINNNSFPSQIPDNSLRIDILDMAHIKEKRIIDFENKNIRKFFRFITRKINE